MADYATLLRDRTTLTCRSVDRIFLEGYVPQLQTPGGAARYLLYQRGFPMPSSAAFGKIGERYVAEIHQWAKQEGIPEYQFQKGENKELYARPLIEAAAREGGKGRVVLLGIAQQSGQPERKEKEEVDDDLDDVGDRTAARVSMVGEVGERWEALDDLPDEVRRPDEQGERAADPAVPRSQPGSQWRGDEDGGCRR